MPFDCTPVSDQTKPIPNTAGDVLGIRVIARSSGPVRPRPIPPWYVNRQAESVDATVAVLSEVAILSPTSGAGVSDPSLSPGWRFRCRLGRDMHGDFVRSAPSSVPAAIFGFRLTMPAGHSNGKPCGR